MKKLTLIVIVLLLLALAVYPALAGYAVTVWIPLVETGGQVQTYRITPTPAPTETPMGWTPQPTYLLCWPPGAVCSTATQEP
jgi:hypothetical protein